MKPLLLRLAGLLRPNAHRHTGGNDGVALGNDMPVGAICLFDGDTPPLNWSFCDGGNGTPDLRDRFIRGANGDWELGGVGGAVSGNTNHTHSSGSLNTDSPVHNHGGLGDYAGATGLTTTGPGGMHSIGSNHVHRFGFPGNESHNHAITGSTAASGNVVDNRPPYYAARYIQRKARGAGTGGSSILPIAGLMSRFFSHNHSDDSQAQFGVPVGAIIPYRGGFGGWPGGYVLCDGGNGTPDLRDRFIIAAGASYGRTAVGGAASVDIGHSHTSGSFGTAAEAIHGGHGPYTDGAVVWEGNTLSVSDNPGHPQTLSSGLPHHVHSSITVYGQAQHTHVVSGSVAASVGTVSNLPAYYQIAFIKRVS